MRLILEDQRSSLKVGFQRQAPPKPWYTSVMVMVIHAHFLLKVCGWQTRIKSQTSISCEILPETCLPSQALQENQHLPVMEYLPWIILDLVFQKVFMATYQVLTSQLMMSLSITRRRKVQLAPVNLFFISWILFDRSETLVKCRSQN